MMNRAYIDAVRLLLEVAPEVFREPVFALKGGTAINLFLHDMPRLSVDLDLVFINHQPGRDEALQRIGTALAATSAILESRGMRCARGSDAEEAKLYPNAIGFASKSKSTMSFVAQCFVCYIAGHSRPVHEVIFANQL